MADHAVLKFTLPEFESLGDRRIEEMVDHLIDEVIAEAKERGLSMQEVVCALFEVSARFAASPFGVSGRLPEQHDVKFAEAMAENVKGRMLEHMQLLAPGEREVN